LFFPVIRIFLAYFQQIGIKLTPANGILMFPGQGSQYAGMTKDLLEHKIVRDTLDEVDQALNIKLSRIMLEGTEAELTETFNAQPAIIAHSIAVLRLLEVR
jgi:[acyl-carrier-protein] S-malonyltransferase